MDLLDRLAKWLLGEPYKQIKMSVIGPQSNKKIIIMCFIYCFCKTVKKKTKNNPPITTVIIFKH